MVIFPPQTVLDQLKSYASQTRREGMSRYFTTSMQCLGVAVPDLRKVARNTSRDLRHERRATVLDLARSLLASSAFEARQLAFEILARHEPTLTTLSIAELEELGAGNDNWASVDAFSTLIAGVLWQRGRLEDATFTAWAGSSSVWWRRTAAVSTVSLNLKDRTGKGDPPRTLMIVDLLRSDRLPIIAKAVSWALRALAIRDPVAVQEYLRSNSSALPALVRREVQRKLETGLKAGRKTPTR